MRSSKNRSRSKGNRNRTVGNIVNRVFDSSGPEGKVRGTPQQIIDKYNQLARDAQLGNDRVAAENFQQHAEHYLRMLSEAQREQDARREQQQQQGGGQGGNQGGNQNQGGQGGNQGGGRDKSQDANQGDAQQPRQEGNPAVIETGETEGSTLVDTPEGGQKPKRSRRRPKKADDAPAQGGDDASGSGKGDTGDASGDGSGTPPREAAE